ncbi:MAG: MoaD/ThiS family protein [Candidatus Brocadiia bacterium]
MPDSDQAITVEVTLRSILAKFRPDPRSREPFSVRLPQGATVGDLVERLGVDEKLAKLIFVDHVRCDRDAALEDGARVDIFPPVAGG